MKHLIIICLYLTLLKPDIIFSYYKRFDAVVLKVHDADTIKVMFENGKTRRIRFLGIDAPEKSKLRYGYKEYLGYESYRFIHRLLKNKRISILVKIKKNGRLYKDRYRRLLAFVYKNQVDICALLLKKGLAKVYRKRKSPKHFKYLEYERYARVRKLGIWNSYKKRMYYRRRFMRTRNDRIILWFWRNDRGFIKRLIEGNR